MCNKAGSRELHRRLCCANQLGSCLPGAELARLRATADCRLLPSHRTFCATERSKNSIHEFSFLIPALSSPHPLHSPVTTEDKKEAPAAATTAATPVDDEAPAGGIGARFVSTAEVSPSVEATDPLQSPRCSTHLRAPRQARPLARSLPVPRIPSELPSCVFSKGPQAGAASPIDLQMAG